MAFRRIKAKQVLSLCPDCDYSFGRHQKKHRSFSRVNISDIFIEHLDELKKNGPSDQAQGHLASPRSRRAAPPRLDQHPSPEAGGAGARNHRFAQVAGAGAALRGKVKALRHLDNVDRAVEQLRPRIAKFGYNREDVRS